MASKSLFYFPHLPNLQKEYPIAALCFPEACRISFVAFGFGCLYFWGRQRNVFSIKIYDNERTE